MPMESQAQRAYLHIHHPQIAAEFEAATPKGKKLPKHVKKKADESPSAVHLQQFMPTQHRRALTENELLDVHRGQKQWLPSIFQSYGTPLPSMLASPWRQGLLAGLAGAGVGGLAGASIGAGRDGSPIGAGVGAALGALGLGGTAGLVTGLSRSAKNEGIIEMMKRLPENAVKRDLLSDPAYQADIKRENDADSMNQFMSVMSPHSMMDLGHPSNLTMGKWSFEEIGQKAALYGPKGCPVPGCTEGNPCPSCLEQEVEEKQSASNDLMATVSSLMKERGPLFGGAGMALGGLVGAAGASPGRGGVETIRGAAHGGLMGLGTVAGAAAGGNIGAVYSIGNKALHPIAGEDYTGLGTMAGAGLGALLAHHAANELTGPMFEPHEEKKEAHVLTEGERASMPKSEFAHPQHAKTKKQKEEPGGYPVPDKQHARSALGFAAMHHGKDSAIYRQVKAKVEAKFGKKSNAFVTSQPLAPAAMHNPFAGATAAPPAMSHPGPGLGSDPFHVLGGMAAQHGIGAHEFTNNMAAGDPFGVHGVPVGGKNPFAAPSPAAARWLSTVNPFAPAPPQAANSGWGKHIADHGWKYGLGAAAAGALLYHLANRKKEQPQYV